MNTLGKWLLALLIAFTFTMYLLWLIEVIVSAYGGFIHNQSNSPLRSTFNDYSWLGVFISTAVLIFVVAQILEKKGTFANFIIALGVIGFIFGILMAIFGFSNG